MEHVVLIGMMGAGKTTIGRILSGLMSRNFIDVDSLIEKKADMGIADIITEKGEGYFRKMEKDTVLSLAPRASSVISTGGGAVMDDEVFLFLKSIGRVVYLKASSDVLFKRTSNNDLRPLLRNGDRLSIIRELLKKREGRYLEADMVIETDTDSPNEIAGRIIRELHV